MAGDLYGARAGEFSNPAGAEVSIDGGVMKVVTPTNVELQRNETTASSSTKTVTRTPQRQ
jgi:hypothetical protein